MDCVHCDRCRLWGKVQTTGYGTALKVLFEEDLTQLDVSKIELVALINTFDRVSRTVESINRFKKMYDEAMYDEESIYTTTGSELDENFPPVQEAQEAQEAQEDQKETRENEPKEAHSPANPKQSELSENPYNGEIKFPPKREDGIFGPGGITGSFKEELNVVYEAFRFMMHSYIIFPKIVYNWAVLQFAYAWNAFVGHVPEQFDFDQLYDVRV
ncbi:unnamed protein product [Ambrosiozyma monospora]|uniref:Unnamed protein product n=1 Tax=Ambrosiozyma monospora TaxID=43982 RepID=A0A9W7DPG1_AMBMO|nr:unnamed protein product [Ambrosiozyma monospora]